MSIGTTIKKIRELRCMSRKELALASGYSVSAIGNLETEVRLPTILNLEKIANALDVPYSIILFLSDTAVSELTEKQIDTLTKTIYKLLNQEEEDQ